MTTTPAPPAMRPMLPPLLEPSPVCGAPLGTPVGSAVEGDDGVGVGFGGLFGFVVKVSVHFPQETTTLYSLPSTRFLRVTSLADHLPRPAGAKGVVLTNRLFTSTILGWIRQCSTVNV